MINRGISKTSQYFFNSETGMLEKVDDNVLTIESLSNQSNSQINTLEDIANAANEESKNGQPINNIVVITVEDNLIHNYFTSMEISWDSSNCLSNAIIKMPKMNTENTNYWSTYTGQLTIYAGYNFTFDYVNSNSYPTEQDAANSLIKYWDNSKIKPFFKGEISRVKEREKDIVIYIDSIGRRFQQKIPDEFRQSFIYNQNVRDSFQAICEFLGVHYICPPKTITDNGEEEGEDESTTTDGTENDVSKQQETVNKIKKIAKSKVNASKDKTSNKTTNQTNNQESEESNSEEGEEEDSELKNNEEIEAPQNGYGDINFDANGAITHGSTIIETSPDMVETLLAMDKNPLEKYLEDETGIVEKVQKFLDGEMFDELHNKVMDYGAITIEPKSTTTSNISTEGTSGSTGDTNSDSNNSSNNNSSSANALTNPQPTSRAIAGHKKPNKITLNQSYINSLKPAQAAAKAKQTNAYTEDTLKRLRRRAAGLWW